MPETRLQGVIFREAALEATMPREHRTTGRITRLRQSMRFLMENGDALKEQERYWPHVEAALRNIYPYLQGDVAELRGLVEEEDEILAKLEAGADLADAEELMRVVTFCQEMWYQLRLLEHNLTPHR